MTKEALFNQHLDEFNKITMKLDSVEVKIKEEDKALLLLPLSFENIMTSLLFRKEILKFDEVIATLLLNETRRGNNGLSSDGQVAMVTKGFSQRQGWRKEKEEGSPCSRSSGRKFKCYYCDEEGHMKRDCPKMKKDLRDKKQSVVGVTKDSTYLMGVMYFWQLLKAQESPIGSWILVVCFTCF